MFQKGFIWRQSCRGNNILGMTARWYFYAFLWFSENKPSNFARNHSIFLKKDLLVFMPYSVELYIKCFSEYRATKFGVWSVKTSFWPIVSKEPKCHKPRTLAPIISMTDFNHNHNVNQRNSSDNNVIYLYLGIRCLIISFGPNGSKRLMKP